MESLQKILINAGVQHFDGFKRNCSHKEHQHLEVISP